MRTTKSKRSPTVAHIKLIFVSNSRSSLSASRKIKSLSVLMEREALTTKKTKASVGKNSGHGKNLRQKKDVIHTSLASAVHRDAITGRAVVWIRLKDNCGCVKNGRKSVGTIDHRTSRKIFAQQKFWYPGQDLNLHTSRHWLLRPACLPFHHPGIGVIIHECPGPVKMEV